MQVDVGRLDRLVTEPQRDDGAIDAVSKELHGSSVAKDMRTDALALQRRTLRGRDGRVLGEQLLQRITAEGTASLRGEDGIVGLATSLAEPRFNERNQITA